MAPTKSTSASTEKKKAKSSSARPSLTQGRISFTASKRTGSGASSAKGKSGKGSPAIVLEKSIDDISSASSTSESEDVTVVVSPRKRAKRTGEKAQQVNVEARTDLEVLEKSGKLLKHYGKVREIMGNIPPGE